MRAHTLSRQLREGNLFAEQCPSREVLKHVTSRWGVLILVALRDGTHRFSDLRRKMGGVSEKMLAQSLQALEQDGFLNRVSYPVVPPHVEFLHRILPFLFNEGSGFIAWRCFKADIQRRIAVDWRQTPVIIRRRMDFARAF